MATVGPHVPHAPALLAVAGFLLVLFLPAAAAQVDLTPEPAPEPAIYRDWYPLCDASGAPGLVAHEFTVAGGVRGWDFPVPGGIPFFQSIVRGYDASNGSRAWTTSLGFWHKLPGPQLLNDHYWAPIRGGRFFGAANPTPYYIAPTPAAVDNFQAVGDANGDGVCDYVGYGWNPNTGKGALEFVSGKDGTPGWKVPISWTRIDAQPVYNLTGFPTGLLTYESPSGPRFAFKTTDVLYDYSSGLWITSEHLLVGDARDGHTLWTRTLLPSITQHALSTYLTGARDIAGSPEPELVLDDFAIVEDSCTAQPDRLDAWALRGEDGATLWGPTPLFTPPQQGQISAGEDDNQCWLWSMARTVGDVNGDGHADVVATYVSLLGGPTTANSRFLMHVVPVSGAAGTLLWPKKDIKVQGWGWVDDLNVANHTNPLIAVGAVDLPSRPSPGGRFPPKDVRMTVLKTADGAPLWGGYRERFSLDSFLIYGLTLDQYRHNLAPSDYDGDGVRDLVTPAVYTEPNSTTQVLLASSGHTYRILSGRTGKTLAEMDAFGPRGEAFACPGEPANQLTVLSGHSRRLDLTRRNVTDDHVAWRDPVYVNRRPQAMVAGAGTIYLRGMCSEDAAGRTVYGVSDAVFSGRRGLEVRPLRGLLEHNGTADWILPKFKGIPPNVATLHDFEQPPPTGLSLGQKVSFSAGSIVSGILSGFGAVGLRTRVRRGGAP